MKKFYIIFLLASVSKVFSQVFWTENFNNGCAAACTAIGYNGGNGPWSLTVTGAEGADPNTFFVSCAENGNAVGTCGSGCGANGTLHLSAKIGNPVCPNDCGAAYDAGGLCGFFFCPKTNRRIESPTINCSGKTTVILNFNYIENGQGLTDDATVWYFDGTVWAQIDNPPKTALGCGGQGIWAARTLTLPASANNNALVKIGFRWVNNDDGAGTDPSVAINDITLSTPVVVLPIELIDFSFRSENQSTHLVWRTVSEKNSAYFEIQRSEDAFSYTTIGKVNAAHNSSEAKHYAFNDKDTHHTLVYYRLKMVDIDNTYQFSQLLAVDEDNSLSLQTNYFVNSNNDLEIDRNYILTNITESISILDPTGKILANYNLPEIINNDKVILPTHGLDKGLYLCLLKNNDSQKTFKFLLFQ